MPWETSITVSEVVVVRPKSKRDGEPDRPGRERGEVNDEPPEHQ